MALESRLRTSSTRRLLDPRRPVYRCGPWITPLGLAGSPSLSAQVLKQVYALEVEYPDKEAFLGLKSSLLVTHAAQWSRCLRAHCPLEALPGNWGDRITDFQRVVLMRVLYPRKFVTCAEWLVSRCEAQICRTLVDVVPDNRST